MNYVKVKEIHIYTELGMLKIAVKLDDESYPVVSSYSIEQIYEGFVDEYVTAYGIKASVVEEKSAKR